MYEMMKTISRVFCIYVIDLQYEKKLRFYSYYVGSRYLHWMFSLVNNLYIIFTFILEVFYFEHLKFI